MQRLGSFIAQLPDSTLRSRHPVPLSAEALDADGKVVAKSSEPLGGSAAPASAPWSNDFYAALASAASGTTPDRIAADTGANTAAYDHRLT